MRVSLTRYVTDEHTGAKIKFVAVIDETLVNRFAYHVTLNGLEFSRKGDAFSFPLRDAEAAQDIADKINDLWDFKHQEVTYMACQDGVYVRMPYHGEPTVLIDGFYRHEAQEKDPDSPYQVMVWDPIYISDDPVCTIKLYEDRIFGELAYNSTPAEAQAFYGHSTLAAIGG